MPENVTTPAVIEASAQQRIDMALGKVPAQPRIRVEKNAAAGLTLSTSWQRVFFSDSNPRNANTFPTETNGKQSVSWDNTNGLFLFNAAEDRNYRYSFYGIFTCSNLLTGLLTPPPQLQYRFVIPNGVSAGVPLTFPFPGQDGLNGFGVYGNLGFNSETRFKDSDVIYANSAIRTNGVGFELKLSSLPALTTIKMTLGTALIYSGS